MEISEYRGFLYPKYNFLEHYLANKNIGVFTIIKFSNTSVNKHYLNV